DVLAAVTRTTVDGHDNRFAYIAHGVLPGRAGQLASLHLDGVGFLDESRRFYPQQDVAAQVLGVVGTDGTGLEGLEHGDDAILAYPAAGRMNRAVLSSYEPGSVNKVIAAAAALESGTVNLKDRFTVPSSMQVYDHRFTDAEPHPTEAMNLADILAYSSNIGM